MSSAAAVPCAAVPLSNARAEVSRRNGAKSRGPITQEGKARSAQNALKHGFRAQKHVVLADEDAAAFKALEAALLAELAPEGVLQTILAQRVARAAWRLDRADRIESELLGHERRGDGDLARAVIRDGHGARALPTLLRYRGAAMAELMRSLRALKALQAEARAAVRPAARPTAPDEPKSRAEPGELPPPQAATREPDPLPAVAPARLQRCPLPDEPERATAPAAIPPSRDLVDQPGRDDGSLRGRSESGRRGDLVSTRLPTEGLPPSQEPCCLLPR
jgi:hypothetical protein